MNYGSVIAPAGGAFAVTPADGTNIYATALYVGVGGDIKVDMENGDSAVTFVGVPTGAVLPIRVRRVYSTDTTATDIVGLTED